MTRYLDKQFSVAPGSEPAYREHYAEAFGSSAGPQYLPCGHGVAWLADDKLHCGACGEPVVGQFTQPEAAK